MYFIDCDEVYKIVYKNIAKLRREQGYTQESFAYECGISSSYYSQIEAPNVMVRASFGMFLDIAGALNVNIKELLEGC